MAQNPDSLIDRLIINADQALRTLATGAVKAERPSPAREKQESPLDKREQQHVAGLMRINHTGEVCAQALYQGQALTALQSEVRESMAQAAREELDHLAWCEDRIREMNSHTSVLNPLFYGLSFTLGALAGVISDRVSLGFVAATENQVCKHLNDHLKHLPVKDNKTRAILEQMLTDEAEHANKAIDAGAAIFPTPVKKLMTLLSKLMTGTTYRI